MPTRPLYRKLSGLAFDLGKLAVGRLIAGIFPDNYGIALRLIYGHIITALCIINADTVNVFRGKFLLLHQMAGI